jgi:hypothetical protein
MKLTKSKLLKQFTQKEDALLTAIEDFRDFLDSTEDEDLSSMGSDLCDATVDFWHTNDTINLNEIRDFIENEFE